MRPRAIRIVTADFNQMSCRLLSEALSREPGLAVVASAADGESLQRVLDTMKPDIALISATLPGGPLKSRQNTTHPGTSPPACPWIALLDESEPRAVVAAFRAGAKGVFSRTQSDIRLLAKCIRRVMHSVNFP